MEKAPNNNSKGNDRNNDLENDTLKFMINMIDKDLKNNNYTDKDYQEHLNKDKENEDKKR